MSHKYLSFWQFWLLNTACCLDLLPLILLVRTENQQAIKLETQFFFGYFGILVFAQYLPAIDEHIINSSLEFD